MAVVREGASREGEVLRGKYRLDLLLGAGGMAQVYKAHNLMAGRTVAIKVLFKTLLADDDTVHRFMREAKAANRVHHPNIVDVLDVDLDNDGVPFLVQEYLQGVDLAEKLDCGWRPTTGEMLDLFIPICEAVGLAHERGVVHRDLKPDNVFLAQLSDGKVIPKVLDFGISKVPFEQTPIMEVHKRGGTIKNKRLTGAGSLLGTPNYMSPEQIRDTRSVDPRSDVWSLGVMMYEALSGDVPFDADDIIELLSRIATTEAPALTRRAPHVPKQLADVVHRCLQPSPRLRYSDAAALGVALIETRHVLHPSLAPLSSRRPPARRTTTQKSVVDSYFEEDAPSSKRGSPFELAQTQVPEPTEAFTHAATEPPPSKKKDTLPSRVSSPRISPAGTSSPGISSPGISSPDASSPGTVSEPGDVGKAVGQALTDALKRHGTHGHGGRARQVRRTARAGRARGVDRRQRSGRSVDALARRRRRTP